jgi:hypothetical protein
LGGSFFRRDFTVRPINLASYSNAHGLDSLHVAIYEAMPMTPSTWSESSFGHSVLGYLKLTTSWARAGIASLLGLGVIRLSEVIGATVNDDSALSGLLASMLRHKVASAYSENALGSDQLNERVLNRAVRIAIGIGLDVSEVTNVTVAVARGAVVLPMRVDCHFVSIMSIARLACIRAYSSLQCGPADVQPLVLSPKV